MSFEVLRLDGLLRLGDAAGDELTLDGHVLFHAEAEHEVLHALAAEDAEQVVLEREVEAGTAGAALAAGATAELIVDAAGFMALGADDMQAAGRDHLIVFRVGLLPAFNSALGFKDPCVEPRTSASGGLRIT